MIATKKRVAKFRALELGFDFKVYWQRVRLMTALRMLDNAGDNKKLQADALKGMTFPPRVKKLVFKAWKLRREEQLCENMAQSALELPPPLPSLG